MNQTYAVQTTGNSIEGKHKHDLEEPKGQYSCINQPNVCHVYYFHFKQTREFPSKIFVVQNTPLTWTRNIKDMIFKLKFIKA